LSEEVEENLEQDASVTSEEAPAQASEEKPKLVRKPAASAGSSAAKPARATASRSKAPAAGAESAAAAKTAQVAPKRREIVVAAKPAPRLQMRYDGEIRGQLFTEFGYKSRMQVPGVKKVIINVGLGEALTNAKALETTPAQISMALPRIRDFRGVSRTAFDGNGNYSLGLREQIMFPEIDYASIDRVRGMQIVITTSAQSDPEGFRLLELMGMPFAREGQTR
jgi:large subunit ribosomal protein L5